MKKNAIITVDKNEKVTINLYLLQKYSVSEALVYKAILDNGGILVASPYELSKKVKIVSSKHVSKAAFFLKEEGVLKIESINKYKRIYTLLDIENPIDKTGYVEPPKKVKVKKPKGRKAKGISEEEKKLKIQKRFDKLPDAIKQRVMAIQKLREEKNG